MRMLHVNRGDTMKPPTLARAGSALLALALLSPDASRLYSGEAAHGSDTPPVRLAVPGSASDREYLGLASDAKQFALDDLRAEVLVVQVFDLYCPVCQKSAGSMNRLRERLRERGLDAKVKTLGIGRGDTPFEVATFAKRFKLTFPTVADRDRRLSDRLEVSRTPTLVVLRLRNGSLDVLARHAGYVSSQVVDQLVERAAESSGL